MARIKKMDATVANAKPAEVTVNLPQHGFSGTVKLSAKGVEFYVASGLYQELRRMADNCKGVRVLETLQEKVARVERDDFAPKRAGEVPEAVRAAHGILASMVRGSGIKPPSIKGLTADSLRKWMRANAVKASVAKFVEGALAQA